MDAGPGAPAITAAAIGAVSALGVAVIGAWATFATRRERRAAERDADEDVVTVLVNDLRRREADCQRENARLRRLLKEKGQR